MKHLRTHLFKFHVHLLSSKLARFNLLRLARRSSMANVQKGFLESISPWPSRTNTPKPEQGKQDTASTPSLEKSQGADHTVTHRHRFRRKDYPLDCPKSNIRWFYAVDVRVKASTSSSLWQIRSILSRKPRYRSGNPDLLISLSKMPNHPRRLRNMLHSLQGIRGQLSLPFKAWSRPMLLLRSTRHLRIPDHLAMPCQLWVLRVRGRTRASTSLLQRRRGGWSKCL